MQPIEFAHHLVQLKISVKNSFIFKLTHGLLMMKTLFLKKSLKSSVLFEDSSNHKIPPSPMANQGLK